MTIYTLRSLASSSRIVAVQRLSAKDDKEALSIARDTVKGVPTVANTTPGGRARRPRSIFLDLMRRCGEASYIAFDLLCLNGRDLRNKPLMTRKGSAPLEHDLKGIVAKRRDGAYAPSANG